MKIKAVAVTGRRPKSLPWGEDEGDERAIALKNRLKYTLSDLISSGYKKYYIGMAEGIDTYVAEILLEFKLKFNYTLSIVAVIPYKGFSDRWRAYSRRRFSDILGAVDEVIYTDEEFSRGALFKRNEYMVDNADALLAVYDNIKNGGTYNTLMYAKRKGKEIIIEEI